jgi:nucleotide-binding universal stress UspA family protein
MNPATYRGDAIACTKPRVFPTNRRVDLFGTQFASHAAKSRVLEVERENAMLTMKRILHPTDFSPSSLGAFQMACALARDYGATLTVLHVIAPPIVAYGEGVIPSDVTDVMGQARAQLERLEPTVPKVSVERRIVEGDAATEILRIAQESKCDAIAIGTHGRTGLGRLLMGSVAEQVMRRAACPVITVKTPASVAA